MSDVSPPRLEVDLLNNPKPGVGFSLMHRENGAQTGQQGVCVWVRGSAAEFAADVLVRFDGEGANDHLAAVLCGTVEAAAKVLQALQEVPDHDRHRRTVRDALVARVRAWAAAGRAAVARRKENEAAEARREGAAKVLAAAAVEDGGRYHKYRPTRK